MITVTPSVQSAIEAGRPPIELVKFEFNGTAPIYLTTAKQNISWDGQTWLSNGFLLDSSLRDDVSELRSEKGKIGLTGVDLSIAAILLNNNQVGMPVTQYTAFLNPSGGVVPGPYIREQYIINEWAIEQGAKTANVILTLAGEWADFEYKTGIKTTAASLQRYYPGDELFKFSKDVKKELRWGGK